MFCRTAFSFRLLGITYRQFCKSSPLSSVDTTRRRHHFSRRPTRAISSARHSRHTQYPTYIYEKFVSLARDVVRERFYCVSARTRFSGVLKILHAIRMYGVRRRRRHPSWKRFTNDDIMSRGTIWSCWVPGVGSGAQRTATISLHSKPIPIKIKQNRSEGVVHACMWNLSPAKEF